MKYNKLIFINYLYILILEVIFKLFILKTYDFNIIYIIIFNLPISIILTLITNITKNNIINRRLSITLWITLFCIFISELIYYSFYQTIFGYKAIFYGTQVATFYNSIIEHALNNIFIIIFMFIPLILLIKFRKLFIFNKFNIKDSLILLITSLIFLLSSLEYNKDNINSVYHIVFYRNNLMEEGSNIGLIPTINIDIYKSIINFQEKIILYTNEIDNDYDIKKSYNIEDIDFDKISDNTNDNTIKDMNNYFKNSKATNKNDYSGILKNKNLIFISAEAFSPIAVDSKHTPTLYKLVHDGLYFKNYYQPIYNCSTSDGEFTNLLSLLPGISTCSMDLTHDKYFPYNIGMVFKNNNYKSYAFHGWTYTYYHRDKSYPNLGFTYYGYDRYNKGYEYKLNGINDSWPTSDVDVVNSSVDYYINEDKFVAYYMSISGHLQYDFNGSNAMSLKHKSEVSDINASNTIKAYIAANIEFDKSLELLINKLKDANKLDDTVIVIAPDHYPYGLTNQDIKSYTNYVNDENFDLYRNNLIIYNTSLEHKEIDKNIYSLDILPTLLNMFGINYDSRLLMGNDIFSNSSDLVIFNNKSWITDKGKYNSLNKKFYKNEDSIIDDNYVDNINNLVNIKFQLSKSIISKDYYKIVLGG